MMNRAIKASQNKWVTIVLNVLALVVMVDNFLLSTPVFPKEWTVWVALAVGLANVVIEWLSKLEV